MKRQISLLLCLSLAILSMSVSAHIISVIVDPEEGGYISTHGVEFEEEENVYLSVSSINKGFVFKGWMIGGDLISEYRNLNYTMPAHDVVVTAMFEYDPELPGNPEPMPDTRVLTVLSEPEDAATSNFSGGRNVEVGSWVVVNSTPRDSGFKFQYWKDPIGEIVSTDIRFSYEMPDQDVTFIACYDYNPDTPANPSPNFFYEESGLLVIGEFLPGFLRSSIDNMISYDYEKLRSLVVSGEMRESDLSGMKVYSQLDSIDLSRTYGFAKLKDYAFEKTHLKKIILPSCVKSIGRYSFLNCLEMESLMVHAPSPPAVDSQSLVGLNNEKCVVYVPAGLVSLYKETEYWKNFEIRPIDGSVEITEPVDAPTASIESGSIVYYGSEVCLAASSNDVEIYYTLDGTDPSDPDGGRILYENSIVIDKDVVIRTIAVAADGATSEIAEFRYDLKRNSLDLHLENGWTWISHNFAQNINLDNLNSKEGIVRIVGEKGESLLDDEGVWTGDISGLLPETAYKLMSSEDVLLQFSNAARNPESPINIHPGINYLGYPLDKTSAVGDALDGADEGDYIVGQVGFAVFHGEEWLGTLNVLEPGRGYMYGSFGNKEISFPPSDITGCPDSEISEMSDISLGIENPCKFPDIMPMVACLRNEDGQDLSADSYVILAFSEGECRGVGKVIDGVLMMSVYGKTDEPVLFKAVKDLDNNVYDVASDISSISQLLQGSFTSPAVLVVDEHSGVDEIDNNEELQISISHRMLRIEGIDADESGAVSIFDSCGRLIFKRNSVEDGYISLADSPSGVYILIVKRKTGCRSMKFEIR